MKAMILAAGVGSRLDPLTASLPKPLVPVANCPVMEHIIRLLSMNGFTDIICNLHYMPEQIQAYFGDGSKWGINLSYRHEEELSGDAGGVRACRDFLDKETFIVMMGDLVTDCDLAKIVAEHRAKKAIATIAIKQVDDVEQFGVVVQDENGFITGFQEKPKASEAKSNRASAGIYVLEPEVFDHMPKDGAYGFGRQLFPKLVEEGLPVLGSEISSYWSDVGTLAQYRKTNFDAVTGQINIPVSGLKKIVDGSLHFLEAGSSINENTELTGPLFLGANSKILSHCQTRGCVVIGDNVTVEENVVLENVVICSGVTIYSNSSLKDCIVGPNGTVPKGSQHVEATLVADTSLKTANSTN